ncbi:MAG TPA: PAS domain-containing sensor histidine kinase [Thermoanaerobaculia bacterium]|nr:PAS domain-containing sensor histidine kinase [Thermoanaerobaculia bacterium]
MDLQLSDSLLNTAPCGYVSFADDGTMRAVNRTLAEMLGYTRAELEGWHLQKILPPGARVFYNTHVFPILKMHGMAEEIYIALRTKDGVDLPMLLNASRRERNGDTFNDCIFVRMLQRHAFEDQLVQARRIAEEASAAKAKFLSMMSHDLRTPLTAISGHADLLGAGLHGALAHDQQYVVQRIREASRDLARMIDDVLSFAQLDSGQVAMRPQRVSMKVAFARAEAMVHMRLEQAKLSFSSTCDDETIVTADPDRLQQILLNLLTNAIKFTAAGGSIIVACERDGEKVLIRVRDTGSGIPPQQLERVFDPFVQLDTPVHNATQRGIGLGLAISRDLARAMDGELTADSTPGEGSVFTLELPVVTASLSS